ncbi:hypothetical protein HAX54_042887 [Datura stramonium]|uniref:Casein kinase substrate phosphoprotein PP28 domain-containing protein n=1 Tax=Datura stramonium TaxID=4076 RepID=A0ABS8W1X5_DATST|nr:hypothetical protein [Datura stramonium]
MTFNFLLIPGPKIFGNGGLIPLIQPLVHHGFYNVYTSESARSSPIKLVQRSGARRVKRLIEEYKHEESWRNPLHSSPMGGLVSRAKSLVLKMSTKSLIQYNVIRFGDLDDTRHGPCESYGKRKVQENLLVAASSPLLRDDCWFRSTSYLRLESRKRLKLRRDEDLRSEGYRWRERKIEKTTELSRREREEIEKQQAHERYMRLQNKEKAEQARKGLERLALIRQQRAEAAKKREEEKAAKEQKSRKLANVVWYPEMMFNQ